MDKHLIAYRKANIADKIQLNTFYKSAYGKNAEYLIDPFWTWLNIENPLHKDKFESFTYLAIDSITENIIGHYTMVIQNFFINNKTFQFAWGMYLYVDEKFRGRGVARNLQDLVTKEHAIFLFISSAISTRKMVLSMEGSIVLPQTYTLSLPLKFEVNNLYNLKIKSLSINKHTKILSNLIKKSSKLKALYKEIITFFNYNLAKILDNTSNNVRSFKSIDETTFSDPRFLLLRSEIANYFENAPNDSIEYLNWKFERHPTKRYKVFLGDGINIDGFVILRIGFTPEPNIGIISEIFAKNDKSLNDLINFSITYFIEKNCDNCHVTIQHPKYLKTLKKAGFFVTNKREPVALSKDIEKLKIMKKVKTWFFSFESQDLDFYPNFRL